MQLMLKLHNRKIPVSKLWWGAQALNSIVLVQIGHPLLWDVDIIYYRVISAKQVRFRGMWQIFTTEKSQPRVVCLRTSFVNRRLEETFLIIKPVCLDNACLNDWS